MAGMVPNTAGGWSFKVDDAKRLHRFLILGVEGGTFYASQRTLTLGNVKALLRMLEAGMGTEVVAAIRGVSLSGRAAKQDPTLFALAVCARRGDVKTRRAAYAAVADVCRIPTHLFTFISYTESMGEGTGWGRAPRRAIKSWYARDPVQLARATTKYRARAGWSHTDVLRLAHPTPASPEHRVLFRYLTKGLSEVDKAAVAACQGGADGEFMRLLTAVEEMKALGKQPRVI